MLPFCPESPRQLVWHGKYDEAEKVLARIYPTATKEQIIAKRALIQGTVEAARLNNYGETRWQKIKQLHTVPSNFRALVCACGLMVISQMSGL